MARWIVDNGHAWLEVSEQSALQAGITPSSYSYIDPVKRTLYLEEDCDAPLYLNATNTHANDYAEHVIDGMAWVRDLPRVTV